MGVRAHVCWVGVTSGGDLWWLGWVVALWVGAQVGAAGRSTLRACRPDYCAGGAGLGLLGWAGSLRVGAPVGAAGQPTLRACRPGFVVVVVDLGLLGWAGSLRVGVPVGAAGRPTMRACRLGFGVGVVDLAERGVCVIGVLFCHCIPPAAPHCLIAPVIPDRSPFIFRTIG